MAPEIKLIFRGVVYHIASDSDDRALRLLLEHNGAKETHNPTDATRIIIVHPRHFDKFKQMKCGAPIVTPEWVYSSVKRGLKAPSQYYSADPTLLFSSTVVSAAGLSVNYRDFIRNAITTRGGQWLPTLTDDVTHLIVDVEPTVPSNCDAREFRPFVVCLDWVRDSLAQEVLLPTAPYEFLKPKVRTDQDAMSAARRFCEGLLPLKSHAPPEFRDKIPIPFVPFEIFAKIFVYFRDDAMGESLPSLRVLLRVSQVCSRWRSIAHCTGELWTRIPLNFHAKRHYRRLQNLFEQWVARSHPRTLAIGVRSCYPLPQNPIVDLLLAHASRIRELSLDLPAIHFHRFLQAPAGSFPMLEKLNMTIIAKSDTIYYPSCGLSRYEYFCEYSVFSGPSDGGALFEPIAGLMTCLEDLPRLQSIRIHTCGFTTLDSRIFPLAWGNLTRIDLGFVAISVFDTAYLLPQFTRVEHLDFATDDKMGFSMPPIPRVRLPHLTALNWNGLDVDDVSIFDRLILPRLASLELRDACQPSRTCILLPSKADSCMPSLILLELRMSLQTTDELLRFLTYDGQRNPVLPNLEELVLCDRGQHFSESVMLRMVESRWETTPFARGRVSTSRTEAHASTAAVHRRRILSSAGGHRDDWPVPYHSEP
ncbi:hypothetical protein K438DRAFT_1749906 [Mycena galopus ATCC 62051]|nr:hypothetical protein K438DRAFT_1749906 [Mycena galopus ATCC 62051]